MDHGPAGPHPAGQSFLPLLYGMVTFRMHVGGNAYLGHWRIAGSALGVLMPSGDGTDGFAKIDRFTITR